MTAGGPTPQPTRSPVAAKAFEIPSTKITYGADSGTRCTGVSWRAFPKVNIQ